MLLSIISISVFLVVSGHFWLMQCLLKWLSDSETPLSLCTSIFMPYAAVNYDRE